jgi:hypothetical protein
MTSVEHIEVVSEWPGCPDVVCKAPTKIAYAAENPKISSDQWGYAVPKEAQCYTWTKLLLDAAARPTAFDDPGMRDVCGGLLLRLPPGKSARAVCQDYLRGLYLYLVSTLKKRFGAELFPLTPMDCWITVPAIWSDKAQALTRNAARGAGFGERDFDTLNVIPEPEAAALTVLKPRVGIAAANHVKVSKGG